MPDKQIIHIIIPFFNSAATIGRTVHSLEVVAPENRDCLRIIGVNDGSTDESVAIFQEAVSRLDSIEWKLIEKPNGGSGSARNAALKMFEDGWVLFLDADDELTVDPVPLIDSSRQASALIFDARFVYGSGRSYRLPALNSESDSRRRSFSAQNPLSTMSVVFRRSMLERLFDENLRYLEDWFFWASNPLVFQDALTLPGMEIGIIHCREASKTAQQGQNGIYRTMVADRLLELWRDEKDRRVINNLHIQKAIGGIQMGEKRDFTSLARIPCSRSLYAKLLIYMFFFGLYLRLYPYR